MTIYSTPSNSEIHDDIFQEFKDDFQDIASNIFRQQIILQILEQKTLFQLKPYSCREIAVFSPTAGWIGRSEVLQSFDAFQRFSLKNFAVKKFDKTSATTQSGFLTEKID